MAEEKVKIISPQQGFQLDFLSSSADIVIGGGSAGAGKTFALLLEPLRHVHNPEFGAVIFRRTYPQIMNPGGLWDTARIYSQVGGEANQTDLAYHWAKDRSGQGARIKFAHLQYDKNAEDYQGSQIAFIGFDELTHFSEYQFFYLLSRNRSICGVRPYVRATCNPDPESWVARFIDWWIDPVTGLPIPERSGKLRYFTRDSGSLVWGDSPEEVIEKCKHLFDEIPIEEKSDLVKSITFIPGSIYENRELLKVNPTYLADLMAQDDDIKERLLKGNWKIKQSTDSLIRYEKILDSFTNSFVPTGRRFITADIAFHGSDKFVAFLWNGNRVEDIEVLEKSDAKQVEEKIRQFAERSKVPRSQIVYDSDGLGSYLRGYLSNAVPFNNGGSPIKQDGKKENYQNLKAQCYYGLAEDINNDRLFINDVVASKRIGSTFVRDLILEEVKAIKRAKPDADGKLKLIPKEQMKNILGRSPDFLDALMMRKVFDLKIVTSRARASIVQ